MKILLKESNYHLKYIFMQHNLLEEKIVRINSATPKLDDFIQNGFDKDYAQVFTSEYSLEYKNVIYKKKEIQIT